MLKIGLLEGSLRKASLSSACGRYASNLLPPDTSLIALPRTDTLPHYNQDIQDAGFPAEVTDFNNAVAAVDAVLFVTPEYNWSIPGSLKNAIDWLSRFNPHPLDGKPAAIWTVSPGLLGGARVHQSLRHVLHSQGMQVMAKPEIQVGGAKRKIDVERGEITDQETADFLQNHLRLFSQYCEQWSSKNRS